MYKKSTQKLLSTSLIAFCLTGIFSTKSLAVFEDWLDEGEKKSYLRLKKDQQLRVRQAVWDSVNEIEINVSFQGKLTQQDISRQRELQKSGEAWKTGFKLICSNKDNEEEFSEVWRHRKGHHTWLLSSFHDICREEIDNVMSGRPT